MWSMAESNPAAAPAGMHKRTIEKRRLCDPAGMVAVSDLLGVAELHVHPVQVADVSRSIRWVATTELAAPAAFFEGGELVLTTGLQTRRWTRRWDAYVRGLADGNVAAIGIGTGLTHDRPPEPLVAACARYRVNLLEVPRGTPFVAVSQLIARLLADEEEQGARAALRAQRLLIAAAVKPDPGGAVLRALGTVVGGAATLGADGRGRLGPFGARAARLVEADVAAEAQRLRRSRGQASTLSGPGDTVVLQPIGMSRRRPTYLAVAGPSRLTEGQRTTIAAAVALLSLIDEQHRGSAETLRHLRQRVIELVIAEHRDLADAVLGVQPAAPALPQRLRVVRASGAPERIEDALAGLDDRGLLAAQYHGEVCLLVEPRRAGTAAAELADTGLAVGVGALARHTGAAESYRTAGVALAQAAPGTVVDWLDIVRRGPLGLIDHDAAEAFAVALLGELSAEQRDLLRCFLIHHGSVLKVAEELDVHRNTVRNRLRAIEAKLSTPLDNAETRVSVWIALQCLPPGA